MKNIISLAIVLSSFATAAFAHNAYDDKGKVPDAFTKNFSAAKEVVIESNNTYTKVAFRLDDQKMFAYYRPTGELMAVTRYLRVSQLPMDVQYNLKAKYRRQWLTDLFEVSADGQTTYYAVLTSAEQNITLRSDVSGQWEVIRKERRSAD